MKKSNVSEYLGHWLNILGKIPLAPSTGWQECQMKKDTLKHKLNNFPFVDGDVPRSPSYGVYILQLIRFATVWSNVCDFNNRNHSLTSKLLKQGYQYHILRKAFWERRKHLCWNSDTLYLFVYLYNILLA